MSDIESQLRELFSDSEDVYPAEILDVTPAILLTNEDAYNIEIGEVTNLKIPARKSRIQNTNTRPSDYKNTEEHIDIRIITADIRSNTHKEERSKVETKLEELAKSFGELLGIDDYDEIMDISRIFDSLGNAYVYKYGVISHLLLQYQDKKYEGELLEYIREKLKEYKYALDDEDRKIENPLYMFNKYFLENVARLMRGAINCEEEFEEIVKAIQILIRTKRKVKAEDKLEQQWARETSKAASEKRSYLYR